MTRPAKPPKEGRAKLLDGTKVRLVDGKHFSVRCESTFADGDLIFLITAGTKPPKPPQPPKGN